MLVDGYLGTDRGILWFYCININHTHYIHTYYPASVSIFALVPDANEIYEHAKSSITYHFYYKSMQYDSVRPPICVPKPNYVLSIEIHVKHTNRFRHTNRGSYPKHDINNKFKY